MAQFYPVRSSVQEMTEYVIRILGAAAANPVRQEGEGVLVTWVSTGKYLITFAENPFQFIAGVGTFICTTMADLKGYTVVFEDYNATAKTMHFTIYNSLFALANLTNTQRLCLILKFARTGY